MLGSNQVDTKWNQIGRYRAAKAGRVEGVECLGCVWGSWMGGKTSYPLGNHKFFGYVAEKREIM